MTRFILDLNGGCFVTLLAVIGVSFLTPSAWAGSVEEAPILYSTAKDTNAITRLQDKLGTGKITLDYNENFGYLPALLKALNISQTSQMLVFSKTSMQVNRIGPRSPRAIYFNDEIFVGYCHQGDVMEITAADPKLGAVFYTIEQKKDDKPQFLRQTNQCLLCHGNALREGIPGHVVTSVYPDWEGEPSRSMNFFRVDHSTPFEQRWGGWYVTGTTGRQVHLGNFIFRGPGKPQEKDLVSTINLTRLDEKFPAERYLTPNSDVVALLVMEHQAEMHNLLTLANFTVRRALFEQAERKVKFSPVEASETLERKTREVCEPVVRNLLFVNEIPLVDTVKGTATFAQEFSQLGPRDAKGRSLRDFDLKRRLFKNPCSYMIYSEMFDSLPDVALAYIYRRIEEIVVGGSEEKAFKHLSPDDRMAIREILQATKPALAHWKTGTTK